MRQQAAWTIGAIILAATAGAPAIAAPCPGATTFEVEACLKSKLDRSQAELDRYVAAATSRIGKEDTPQTQKAFKAAQNVWSAYRDRECDAVYTAWEPGTIKGSMTLLCLQRLTDNRTHEIWRNWLTNMGGMPPTLPEPMIHTDGS